MIDSDLASIIILLIADIYISIKIYINRRTSWANEPLVGMSYVCMILGTVIIITSYVLTQNQI